MWLNDLADACRGSGLPVVEHTGWRARSHGQMTAVKAVTLHHTGASGSGAIGVVRDGRAGLAGPLAQLALGRDGSVHVLANGVAWHAGTGRWPSIGANNMNSVGIGIEAVYNGSDITDAQRAAYPRLVAALCRHYRIPVGNVLGHREWATPAGRKSDPGRIDLDEFRRTVAALVAGGTAATPAPAATPPRKVLDMPERAFGPGNSSGRIICPTGSASAVVSRAWLSASVDGTCRIEVWAQKSGGGNVATGAGTAAQANRDWTLRPGDRGWLELPSGTEFVTWRVTNSTGPGSVALEQLPK